MIRRLNIGTTQYKNLRESKKCSTTALLYSAEPHRSDTLHCQHGRAQRQYLCEERLPASWRHHITRHLFSVSADHRDLLLAETTSGKIQAMDNRGRVSALGKYSSLETSSTMADQMQTYITSFLFVFVLTAILHIRVGANQPLCDATIMICKLPLTICVRKLIASQACRSTFWQSHVAFCFS